MKPPAFDYVEPADLDDAVAVLAEDEDARVLAGGQSLVPMLNFRLAYPSTLVGLGRLPSLRGIEIRNDAVTFGAMVTQREALDSATVAMHCPLVAHALARVGHPQIRARGTIGGSLAHADPAAELPAVLVALGGTLTVRGPGGTRTVAAEEFYRGFYSTCLEPGEILIEARFPVAGDRTGAACVELARRPGDFAMLGAAGQLSLHRDGSIAEAHLALFAVSDAPVRARSIEDALRGARPSEDSWAAAAALATDGWGERGDDSDEARYRRRVAPTVVRRTLIAAAERAAGPR